MSNATHRKKIARAYAAQAGLSYSAALAQVVTAAEQGRLPSRLDDVGVAAAVRVLTDGADSPTTDTEAAAACAHPSTEYVADTGMVCQGCRTVQFAHEQMVGTDAFYLEPSSLRRLREVWQGRVAFTRYPSTRLRFEIDNKPASDIKDIELRWLAKHGYIDASLPTADEWVVVRTTDFGDAVLAVNGADRHTLVSGLPRGASQASGRRSAPVPSKPGGGAQAAGSGPRPVLLPPLSEDEANAVFDVLVRTIGAVEDERAAFVEQQTTTPPRRSRLFGALIEGDATFHRSIGPRADESEGEQWLVWARAADRFTGRNTYLKAALVALDELRVQQGHNVLVTT